MPRALIVTYPWLPLFNASVKQVATLCRYLPAADWEPHILTRDWGADPSVEAGVWGIAAEEFERSPSLANAARLPVVRTSFAPRDNRWLRWHDELTASSVATKQKPADAVKRRALDAAYPWFGHHPDIYRGWVESAVDAGMACVRQFGISAIVSVCPPATAHIVAGEIARRASIPWVVLFDELADFYHGPGDGRSRRGRWRDRMLATRWLRGASRAACASPAMVAYVREQFGIEGDVIVSPFDPEERRVAPHRTPGAPLRLVHTGSIRPGDQSPAILFDALDMMLAETPSLSTRIVVELVGSLADASLLDALRGRPCEAVVRVLERVAPADAVRLQREADVLLAFSYQDSATRASGQALRYPSKVFEHMGANRPTLAVGFDHGGYMTELLSETKGGEVVADAAAASAVLRRMVDELREDGIVAFTGDDSAIARYAAPEQAKRLGALIDAACGDRFGSWERARR